MLKNIFYIKIILLEGWVSPGYKTLERAMGEAEKLLRIFPNILTIDIILNNKICSTIRQWGL